MKWLKRRSETERLCGLLLKAERRLRALGDKPVWSSYGSGPAIGDFVARARHLIEADKIDQATLEELWCIFAPTCDWDDVVGHVGLGQAVFDSLERAYGKRVGSSGAPLISKM
ncbi:MAG: hypothetical protein GY842_16545 [bacterium]|nr:hypothetical protein [bacterium]